jgi:hypothetical protein
VNAIRHAVIWDTEAKLLKFTRAIMAKSDNAKGIIQGVLFTALTDRRRANQILNGN